MKTNSTIAAISTAQGEGGIGVIRVSGDGAIEIADKVFKNINNKKIKDMKGYTAAFGSIVFEGEKLDEAVALVFRAPHSYTGEDVVELSCHGGMYITKQVLRAVLEAGAVPAEAGEFTKRAFLNGKLDLTEAEAVIDIISAKSKSAARSAICVKEGALRTGRPNVGKSTLMNLLSGTEKSIVTDIPGTTRDVVEDTVLAGDVILRLSDTAGLRDTDDAVEKIGVDRARKKLSQCGLLLAVFDNSRELDSDDLELIEMSREVPTVAIINKTDLQAKLDINKIKSDISNIVYVSAANGEGREDIINAVEKIAGTQNLNPSEGILSNERQRSNVYNALNSVREAKAAVETGMTFDAVTVSLEDAISELLEMTGEKTSDEVIDRVFHNFCVGK